MIRTWRQWIVATLCAALLIPEAVSANSPVPMTEGFIRFENGAPVEFIMSGNQNLFDGLTIEMGAEQYALALTSASSVQITASSSTRRLVSTKFQSRKWLREHNRLKRRRPQSGSGNTVSPAMFECGWQNCYDVRNIRDAGRPWYKVSGHSVLSGNNGETISLSFQQGVANGISNKFGLSVEFLSAETGVNITYSWTATFGSSVTVPRGKCYILNAYKVYQDYTAELWKKFPTDSHWTHDSDFRFWEFVGTGFRSFEVTCP